ncbi:agmatinase [Urinicoccus timonensis]|uniref:agmatinase n=1 Tax=Urinicoccus timonensis TaxID=2024205 RepID=UPI000C08306D|nr:agmatinase [Urinicoccus timonensis]
MKTTNEMIKDKDLWAGLNNPDLAMEDADIVVFGQAFDGATSVRKGAADGPRSIREYSYSITPTTEDFELMDSLKIKDLGDFQEENQEVLFDKVQKQVEEIVKAKKFFTMIGGDHSVTIPVHRALNKVLDDQFGIIHIDAHFDLCDTLSGSPLSHGCPARRATELDKVNGSDGVYFVGIRSIELDELEFKNNNPVHVINARRFQTIGIEESVKEVVDYMSQYKHVYVTIDIDCLDPGFAGGTGTPQFGGLTPRELLEFLRGIFCLPIIGFDVVEVAPSLDSSLTSTFAARKVITECWGHYWRKNQK